MSGPIPRLGTSTGGPGWPAITPAAMLGGGARRGDRPRPPRPSPVADEVQRMGLAPGRRVLGAPEVAVEDPAQGVAGQILQARVDRHAIGMATPPRGRGPEARAALARRDVDLTAKVGTVEVEHADAVLEQRVVERPVEMDLEGDAWTSGPGPTPEARVDPSALGGSHPVASGRR